MKIDKIVILLVLLLIFGCQREKKMNKIEVNSTNEKKNTVSKSDSTKYKLINISDEGVYRNITELDKYKGFTEVVGMVLEGTDKALSYIQKDSLQVLVLEQIIQTNSSKVNFKTLDEVRIIVDKAKLFSEPANCELIDSLEEKFVFGIVNDQEKEYFDQDHILEVWKINVVENKFEKIDKKLVKCFNHWFGYDG